MHVENIGNDVEYKRFGPEVADILENGEVVGNALW